MRSFILGLIVLNFLATACKPEKWSLDDVTTKDDTFVLDVFPSPDSLMLHRGLFSEDYKSYFYTVSDHNFEKFDILKFVLKDGKWLDAGFANFNSKYSDHGMSFSPNGKSLYFSSTRPVELEDAADTWHLWRVNWENDSWSEPEYIDIPNLRDKLTSHPSITKDGDLYFHSSNLDYSQMKIFHSRFNGKAWSIAKEISIAIEGSMGQTTAFVSSANEQLFFANIDSKSNLDLYEASRNDSGEWGDFRKLGRSINHGNLGNPVLSSDGKFLFYLANNTLGSSEIHGIRTSLLK